MVRDGMGDSPILCVGAAHWDVIGRARAPLARGADVPGVATRRPGGVALNVALALGASGRRVTLLSAVGDDAEGDALLREAEARGVDRSLVLRHGRPTDLYVAIEEASGELNAAVADCAGLEAAGVAIVAPLEDGRLEGPWTGAAVVDTNVSAETIRFLAGALGAARLVAVSCASAAKVGTLGPLLAAPGAVLYFNRAEAEAFCGTHCADARAAAAALGARGVRAAVVTDGAGAAAHVSPEGLWSAVPPPARVRGVTGAGDVFLAAHVAATLDGATPSDALETALDAAARHVSKETP